MLPVAFAAADAEEKVFQHTRAFLGVRHFGMKLHAVEAVRIVGHGGHRAVRCVRNGHKALRRARHLIGMAHPAGALGPEPCQQAAVYPVHGHIGAPVFAARAALHWRAQQVRHQLHAVADAQNRHAQLKYALVHPGRALIQHAGRASPLKMMPMGWTARISASCALQGSTQE